MIEIKQKNNIWEVFINGSLFYYSEHLDDVLLYLSNNIESIYDELIY